MIGRCAEGFVGQTDQLNVYSEFHGKSIDAADGVGLSSLLVVECTALHKLSSFECVPQHTTQQPVE